MFIFHSCRNLKCGSIFCEGGGDSITGKRAAYNVYLLECKLAVDDDKTRSLDMVPEGTRCGLNKVDLSAERHITFFKFMLDVNQALYSCTGLPQKQMHGPRSLRKTGGLCKEMQQPRGE